jgi:KDO2-lipid IV(A) lauroyltransferase
MRLRRRWLDYLAYLALRMATTIFHMFPVDLNLRTASLLGTMWAHWPAWLPVIGPPLAKHRRRAEEHLRRAFPGMSQVEIRRIAIESMQSMAMLAMEVLFTPRLVTPWTWRRYIRFRNFEPGLRALLSSGGCVMETAHYGNWELLGYTLASLGFEIVAVMRPLDNPYLNDYLMGSRERSGLSLLYKKGASRSMSEVLEAGQALCFIADQNAGSKGLFVDFFGRAASTYKSIGLLAIQHRVPIVVGYARRLGRRMQYEIGVTRVIHPADWDQQEDPLLWITQAYSRAMEEFIRESPGQYLWIHRRWKSRPKTEQENNARACDKEPTRVESRRLEDGVRAG